jgi:hypothetical protein
MQSIGALLVFVVAISVPACMSKSPFSYSPAEVAMDQPCRYIGTFHRESRTVLENLRMDGAVTRDEWLCMTRRLEEIDDDYSERCRERDYDFAEIAADQVARYRGCFAPERERLAECAILFDDESTRPSFCD